MAPPTETPIAHSINPARLSKAHAVSSSERFIRYCGVVEHAVGNLAHEVPWFVFTIPDLSHKILSIPEFRIDEVHGVDLQRRTGTHGNGPERAHF